MPCDHALCLMPLGLLAFGLDLSSLGPTLLSGDLIDLNPAGLQEAAHSSLRGSFTHTIFEWTALSVAGFIAVLAFTQYHMTKERSLPIIGMALVCAGAMDGFHTLAADRLIEAMAPANVEQRELPTIPYRILLAEDGMDNQRLISRILEKAGAKVTIADNGRIALDTALASRQNGNVFDIILMDMQMPEMDGYAATQELRAAKWNGPIIALTAHAMSGDREKCLAAGCDEFTTKPVNRRQLITKIHDFLGASTEPGSDPSP